MDQEKVITNRGNSGRKNINDFSDEKTGRLIVHDIFYDGKSIESISIRLSIPEDRIIKFIEALYSDELMQCRYDFSIVSHGLRNTVIENSFVKREAMSSDENDYSDIPKEYLRLGWVCPEEY